MVLAEIPGFIPHKGRMESLLEQGLQALCDGRGHEAKSLFASAVLANPADANALFGMSSPSCNIKLFSWVSFVCAVCSRLTGSRQGLFHEVMHQFEPMIQWLDATIEADPGHIGAWEVRSRCREHQGRLAEALAGYEHLANLDASCARPFEALLEQQDVHLIPLDVWTEAEPAISEEQRVLGSRRMGFKSVRGV